MLGSVTGLLVTGITAALGDCIIVLGWMASLVLLGEGGGTEGSDGAPSNI